MWLRELLLDIFYVFLGDLLRRSGGGPAVRDAGGTGSSMRSFTAAAAAAAAASISRRPVARGVCCGHNDVAGPIAVAMLVLCGLHHMFPITQ